MGIFWTCWPASLVKLVSCRSNLRPCLRKIGGEQLRKTSSVGPSLISMLRTRITDACL